VGVGPIIKPTPTKINRCETVGRVGFSLLPFETDPGPMSCDLGPK
jgi:hypothetical protein